MSFKVENYPLIHVSCCNLLWVTTHDVPVKILMIFCMI